MQDIRSAEIIIFPFSTFFVHLFVFEITANNCGDKYAGQHTLPFFGLCNCLVFGVIIFGCVLCCCWKLLALHLTTCLVRVGGS